MLSLGGICLQNYPEIGENRQFQAKTSQNAIIRNYTCDQLKFCSKCRSSNALRGWSNITVHRLSNVAMASSFDGPSLWQPVTPHFTTAKIHTSAYSHIHILPVARDLYAADVLILLLWRLNNLP